MKKFITLAILVLAGAFGAVAQTAQTDNQFSATYTFLRQDVKFTQQKLKFDENTDSHGFTVGATHFVGGSGLGLTAEFGANVDGNSTSLVTAMVGPTLQIRSSKFVQPFVRVLGGAARTELTRKNISDFNETKLAYSAGGGIDINLKANSRYKLRFGADYVATRFHGERNDGLKLSTGFVF